MEKLCECGCGGLAPISPVNHKKWGYIKGIARRFIRGHANKGKKYSPEFCNKNRKRGEKSWFKKGHSVPWDVIKYIQPYQKGKNHWHWKGGITKLAYKIRNCNRYRSWRKSVFERDNYTCQFCYKRGGYLEVDHITGFAILLREKRWKEMWDINNGRTLCRPCHDRTKDNHERPI